MAATVDIRIDSSTAEFSVDGLYRHFLLSRKIDVPALIAAATLTASGLISGNTYKLFNIPKYTIVKGAFIVVRTVDTGGGTITVKSSTPTSYTGALAISAAGVIIDASGAGWTIANIEKFNTGIGTDYIAITIGTADVTTAIFDVVVEAIAGRIPYSVGSIGTGQ